MEMATWAMCFLHKHEDLSLDFQLPYKKLVACTCSPHLEPIPATHTCNPHLEPAL